MAKVPIGTSNMAATESSTTELTARIDLKPGMNLPEGVTLGSKLSVEVTGVVTSMRGGEMSSYKDAKGKERKSIYPGSLTVKIVGLDFELIGEFDGMVED